jgi:hypothetical protein
MAEEDRDDAQDPPEISEANLTMVLRELTRMLYDRKIEAEAIRLLLIEKGLLSAAEITNKSQELREKLRTETNQAVHDAEMEQLLQKRREQ